ncbi:hypothetical protein BY457_11476 [Marinilabilia salmonicolor]|jgi:hypothetical protein|uniref:hypothetical protein n=1 Tax=Marinilabilia salmonicolor TaxID=989 RepID=UPI000D06B429|nr:hypothetical protein [Marinilabilia salmonicolor]PRY96692.1 hypothetical protein BY457_11476 [Marinilabilia salmonicolor]
MIYYCVAATVDAGLINHVMEIDTATRGVALGYHILPGTITPDRKRAEELLKQWQRSPFRLTKELEKLVIY